MNSATTSSNHLKPAYQNSPKSSGKNINRSQASSIFNPVNNKDANNTIDINLDQQQQTHISRRNLQNPSKLSSIETSNPLGNAVQLMEQPKRTQEFSIDNYYNINTLATLAAASPSIQNSPSMSPSRNLPQKLYPIAIEQVKVVFKLLQKLNC